MINMKGMTHFTIPVSDLQRSKGFYCDLIGFEYVRENPHMVFCKCQDDYFVLTLSDTPINPNEGDGTAIHHAWYVDDAEYDKAVQYLKDNDVHILAEEDRDTGAFTGRSVYFHDPDRNVLELHNSNKD